MRRVSVFNAHPARRITRSLAARCVRAALRSEERRNAEITVVFLDGRACRKLNRQFLGHDRQTDVISFPLGERETTEGEVYVNIDRARVQAREYGVSERNEVARLVVHGTLHLLGYDDSTKKAAARMRKREDAIVRRLRVA